MSAQITSGHLSTPVKTTVSLQAPGAPKKTVRNDTPHPQRRPAPMVRELFPELTPEEEKEEQMA
jgi:ABC-type oligopeptide transport system substrate-binding subunit